VTRDVRGPFRASRLPSTLHAIEVEDGVVAVEVPDHEARRSFRPACARILVRRWLQESGLTRKAAAQTCDAVCAALPVGCSSGTIIAAIEALWRHVERRGAAE